jgi:hypothetical protein
MRAFTTAILLALATQVHASPMGASDKSIDLPVTVSSAAFTSLAMNSARTIDELNVWGLEYVTFTLEHDANVSATEFLVTCEYSDETTAATWAVVPAWTWSTTTKKAGAQKTWGWLVSGTATWPVVVTVSGYRWLRCTVTGTGAAAGDTMTVTAKGSTE